MKKDIHHYEDIINMPRPVSKKHPQMARQARAIQFAPFAALTGHKERIVETERLTTQKKELDVSQQEIINRKLQQLLRNIDDCPEVTITYFIADLNKTGGKYITITGQVKKVDSYEKRIVLLNETIVRISDIFQIEILSSSNEYNG
ncbi:MAG: hypothetical protein ACLROI_05720 [Beduini sp.]|uniref:hypothetical protein n=1 Tax=Beduini sp. TaxID=1922300 RepID=UPI003990D232